MHVLVDGCNLQSAITIATTSPVIFRRSNISQATCSSDMKSGALLLLRYNDGVSDAVHCLCTLQKRRLHFYEKHLPFNLLTSQISPQPCASCSLPLLKCIDFCPQNGNQHNFNSNFNCNCNCSIYKNQIIEGK